MNPTSIGDTWIVCALARAFKKTHGGQITMVVKPSQIPIAQMYQNDIDRIIQIDENTLTHYSGLIQQFCMFDIDQPFVAHPFFVGDGRLIRLFEAYGGRNMGGIGFTDIYRHILHLDWNAPIASPAIPHPWREDASIYANEIGVVPGASVILFPDNNSCENLPTEFWQLLVNKLISLGLKVFTNMAGNASNKRAKSFDGTTPIDISISSVIPLVEMAGRYISGSNGMACMLAGCRVNSKGTFLLNQRTPGKEYSVNGSVVEDAVRQTSLKHLWITNDPIREYVVCPDEDMSSVILDIAEDNPKSALPVAVYPGFSR